MNKKNLMSQMVKPVSRITIQDLPVELIELSENELKNVVDRDGPGKPKKPPKITTTYSIDVNLLQLLRRDIMRRSEVSLQHQKILKAFLKASSFGSPA